MNKQIKSAWLGWVFFIAAPGFGLPLEKIKLPEGFEIAVYTDKLPGARSMALGPDGLLFVGTRGEGNVYAVRATPHPGKAGAVVVIAKGLEMPNGVAYKDGALYVAEASRILRYDDIARHLDRPPEPVVVNHAYPRQEGHGWKFIRFGPEGRLYIPVGAPCNNCDQGDPYASITRLKADGSGFEVFARGIRNTVGFDWHPATRALWFTDNGRDYLGDDAPPDELNAAPRPGMNFGFPYCHGGDLPDPELGAKHPCSDFTPPARKLGAHVAALGMRFYTGTMFPARYRHQIFIAEHGSWNRTRKNGYRIMWVRLEDNRAVSYEPFAEGWLQGDSVWGRPVDVQVAPDGALLVSDDKAGAVYRISYRTPQKT